MSVLLFFGVLFVLILVHEWGHFIVAKKTGMRVDEFGIGFPPKLFGIKKGETEYTFNAFPIGGFVKIFGENGTGADDGDRAFNNRPKWAQALVLVAGVVMNILFAWILFSVTFMVGVPTAVEEATAGPDAVLMVAGTLPDSPAAVIPPGATVLSLTSGEETITSPGLSEFSEFVHAVAPSEIAVSYELGDAISDVRIAPVQGLLTDEPERYAVGVSLALIEIQKQSFGDALINGAKATGNGLQAITVGLFTLIGQSFSGTADFTQVAGPIGIVGMVGDAAAFGLAALLTFTAVISLNLAVINLLPFPALDGGRLVFVAIEAVTGKDIPPEWAGRINLVGFALLLLLMVAVTYNDIINLL
jgi:regulator of sigma E protease